MKTAEGNTRLNFNVDELQVIIMDHFELENIKANKEPSYCQTYITKTGMIPRIGEKINWKYEPVPKVKDIVYDLEYKKVYVIIG